MSVMTEKTANIIILLFNYHYIFKLRKKARENRKKQISIVETVILYGCQDIALRCKNETNNIGITEPTSR